MKKIIFYDKENDILTIHNGFSDDEKFKGNIDIGNLILDVSTRGRIKGIEIMNATSFFKEFDITKEILKNLINVEFKANVKPDSLIIGIVLKSKIIQHKIPAKIAVPLETPIKN